MPVEIKCASCGCGFKVPPSAIRRGRKYCSMKCSKDIRGEKNPNWKGGLVKGSCVECGKETYVKKSHAEKGAGKFCSYSCKGIFFGRRISEERDSKRFLKNCKVCNKDIYVKPSHKEKEGTYCSHECMASDYKLRLAGESNPNWRNGVSSIPGWYNHTRRCADGKYTNEDIKRIGDSQKWKCANCMKKVDSGYHIDHIMPIALGGSNWPENLQILCPNCNLRKNAMHPIEWANKNGRLL